VETGAVASLAGAPTAVISGGLGCLLGVAVVWKLMPRLAAYLAPDHGPDPGSIGPEAV
jgi:hypothetical protein